MNALIQIDVKNLGRKLVTWQAKQLCGFTAKLVGVPEGAVSVSVQIYKTDGTHFVAIPCNRDDNGDWYVKAIGACFPTTGEVKYQIGYKDEDENAFAAGVGKIVVEAFDLMSGGTPSPEGDIIVTEIPDANGVAHAIKAVKVDGEWTWQIAD